MCVTAVGEGEEGYNKGSVLILETIDRVWYFRTATAQPLTCSLYTIQGNLKIPDDTSP